MTRITDFEVSRSNLIHITRNREAVNKYGNEISTGTKVHRPEDSSLSGLISQYQSTIQKIEGFKTTLANVTGYLTFQDNALQEASSLLLRAKEIATQGANETNDENVRRAMAEEVFQIRDHMISLANSKYQGRYVFAGAADDTPAFSAATYTNPGSGAASQRYAYTSATAGTITRTVQVTDDLSLEVNEPGSTYFSNAVYALERLGRALQGYQTTVDSNGVPDGTGNAYTFPTDFHLQTTDIQATITALDDARTSDVEPARVEIGGKLRRLDTAASVLEISKNNADDVLGSIQNADIAESASKLSQAETALQASMAVSVKVLNLSILDYI